MLSPASSILGTRSKHDGKDSFGFDFLFLFLSLLGIVTRGLGVMGWHVLCELILCTGSEWTCVSFPTDSTMPFYP